MTHWTPQDWMIFFGAALPFLTAVVALVKSLMDNTRATNASKDATVAHTAALVAGTGDGGTTVVNVTQPPTPPPPQP